MKMKIKIFCNFEKFFLINKSNEIYFELQLKYLSIF